MGYHSQTQLYPPGVVIRDYAYDSDHELATGVVSSMFDGEVTGSDDEDEYDDIDYDEAELDDDEDEDDADYSQWSKGRNEESDDADEDVEDDDEDEEGNELYGTDEINRRAVALFDFVPENDNEVALSEGQLIWISYRHGQGWLVAEDPTTGKNGLVPEEYVEIYHDYDEEIVFEQLPPPHEQNYLLHSNSDTIDNNAEQEQKEEDEELEIAHEHEIEQEKALANEKDQRTVEQDDSQVAEILEGVSAVAL